MVDTEAVKNVRDLFRASLLPYKPDKKLRPPVKLETTWYFEATKRHPPGWMIETPDLDNMNKLLADTMQELEFFANDKEIAELHTAKRYAFIPGIFIRLSELEEIEE